MINVRSKRFHLTVPYLLSEFIFEMDTKKNESTEEWLREVMILRNQYIFRCPDELRHDFETAVNGVILGKINGRDGNDEDHSSAPFRRFQFITEWNVKQYCETIENNGLKS